jgi:hypothetical protein
MQRSHRNLSSVYLPICFALLMNSSVAQTLSRPLSVEQTSRVMQSGSGAADSALPDVPTATPPLSTAPGYIFPSTKDRRRDFLVDVIGPGAFLDPAIQSAFDQAHALKVGYPADGFVGSGMHPAHGEVPEWSEGFVGYSKRYASRFGMGLIGTTTRYGLGEILHQDVSYHRCQCSAVLPRAFHAITQSFIAHSSSGKALPSLPALIAPFAASEISTLAWYPARYNASDALRTSTALYLGLPIKNLVNEFKRR